MNMHSELSRVYVPFLCLNDKHDKKGFLFKTRARLFDAPQVTTLWQYLLFLDHFSANERNTAMQEDRDQLSNDDTILDHIEKVNKGKRQKMWNYVNQIFSFLLHLSAQEISYCLMLNNLCMDGN